MGHRERPRRLAALIGHFVVCLEDFAGKVERAGDQHWRAIGGQSAERLLDRIRPAGARSVSRGAVAVAAFDGHRRHAEQPALQRGDDRFGMAIRGAKSNERRMLALGFSSFRYQLVAFVIAGAMAGVAGALLANQTLFLSPNIMHWTRSGEIMMMVILGGMGTLTGPVIGAALVVTLENYLAATSLPVPVVIGCIFVACVLVFRRGIAGEIQARLGKQNRNG